MEQLYDLGYQEIHDFHLVERAIKGLNAVLLDARFMPRSRNPQYNQSFLIKTFGQRYVHIKEFGNKNYKGGPIEYVAFDMGIARLRLMLDLKPCVLMCGCYNRKSCHRYNIAFWLEANLGIKSIPLTKALCQEIVEANDPKQLTIF